MGRTGTVTGLINLFEEALKESEQLTNKAKGPLVTVT